MASSFTIFVLLCLVSFTLALSVPTDGSTKDVLHYQPASRDVKIRVKRQRNRNRNRNRGPQSTIQGVSQPFCDKFGCNNRRQPNRRQCGNGFIFDSRSGGCRRVRGG
ncbi:hypothetical protein JTE90_017434 [Oedothorax gibbosus]|uniref:Uncharacterized protein n=1 Tax=Oedothorax gibbosus TaxID=931172 RepID=A0AAV6TT60_9ARAC|nr:hypothetical protein JTE90_017434 [Oedothorax gibbosus]